MAKKMNTSSNAYTVAYAAAIVVVVAFLLAFVSSYLKPMQDVNVALDKKRQILAALNVRGLDDGAVAERYAEIVRADDVIDADGNVTEEGTPGGEGAGFRLGSADYKEGRLALYVCEVDGQTKYVVPVYGMGLWGPISGYIGIDGDRNTVFGAYFDHEGETAGLGAEIKDSQEWQGQFHGKSIRKDGRGGIALAVRKSNEVRNPEVEVDAVTGATLTSNGVSDMLGECLGKYLGFLDKN